MAALALLSCLVLLMPTTAALPVAKPGGALWCPANSTLADGHCVCAKGHVCQGLRCGHAWADDGFSLVTGVRAVARPAEVAEAACVPVAEVPCRTLLEARLHGVGLPELVGHWEEFSTETEYEPHSLAAGKACPFFWEGFWCPDASAQGRRLNPRFVPAECSFGAGLEAERLLNQLADRRLVFVGDSLMRETFLSVACRLARKFAPTRAALDGIERWRRGFHSACGLYPRNATLCYFAAGKKRGGAPAVLATLERLRAERLLGPSDVLVVNIGVHFFGEALLSQVRGLLALRKEAGPDFPMVIWRETLPQHFPGGEYSPGDEADTGSPCSETPKEALRWQLPEDETPNKYNRLTSDEIEQAGVPVLRVWRASAMQPHQHLAWPGSSNNARDCTHFCLGGVTAFWDDLLFEILQTPTLQVRLRQPVPPSAKRPQDAWADLLTFGREHRARCDSTGVNCTP